MHLAKRYDLVLIVFWGLSALEVAAARNVPSILQAIVGLPLVLVLPGYATMVALFPRRMTIGGQRNRAVRTTLDYVSVVLGIDLAELIVFGLILNTLPPGLDHRSWLVCLSIFSLAGAGIAALRQHEPPVLTMPSWPRNGLSVLFASLVCISLLGGSVAVAIVSAHGQQNPDVQRLWMLPDSSGRLQIGVNPGSRESQVSLTVLDGPTVLAKWPELHLAPNSTWKATILPPPISAGSANVVQVHLRPISSSSGHVLSVSYELPVQNPAPK